MVDTPTPDFWRQLDIVRPVEDLTFPVTIIGCGGIGSPTTLALAKMGVGEITVYDDDFLETHNLPNQIYKLSDVGKAKVESLLAVVEEFTGNKIKIHPEKVGANHKLGGVVISGVDTMAARAEIWKSIRYKPNILIYIDARMGAEVCRIHTVQPVNPEDVRNYEKTLFTDEQATELRCTAQAVIYNVFMIAALITNQVKKFARGEPFPKEVIFDLHSLIIISN
jgi:predicted ThiF/HesA family dinucleotide-utilizing enzyme